MKKIYYLDLPIIPVSEDGDRWKNYDIYFSRKVAIKMLREIWGIRPRYADLFITEGEVYPGEME